MSGPGKRSSLSLSARPISSVGHGSAKARLAVDLNGHASRSALRGFSSRNARHAFDSPKDPDGKGRRRTARRTVTSRFFLGSQWLYKVDTRSVRFGAATIKALNRAAEGATVGIGGARRLRVISREKPVRGAGWQPGRTRPALDALADGGPGALFFAGMSCCRSPSRRPLVSRLRSSDGPQAAYSSRITTQW